MSQKKKSVKGKTSKTAAPAVKNEKEKKGQGEIPPLLEFALSFSKVLVILVGLVIITLSLSSGVSPVVTALRACVGMFAVGAILYGLTWMISDSALQVAKENMQKQREEQMRSQEENHTMEVRA